MAQITLYHVNTALSTNAGATYYSHGQIAYYSDDDGGGAMNCGAYHDVYRRNGSTDYEIAVGVGAQSGVTVANEVKNIGSSWTPSSTVAFGSGDYVRIHGTAYVSGQSAHEQVFTDATDNRGTLQTTAVPLYSGIYAYTDGWDTFAEHYSGAGAGYATMDFVTGGAAADFMRTGKFWGA